MKRNIFNLQEFLTNGKEAKEFNEITQKIITKENEKLIDEKRVKRDKAWSVLANQVVGAEKF